MAIDLIRAGMQDPAAPVRRAAVETLPTLSVKGDMRAVGMLCQCLADRA